MNPRGQSSTLAMLAAASIINDLYRGQRYATFAPTRQGKSTLASLFGSNGTLGRPPASSRLRGEPCAVVDVPIHGVTPDGVDARASERTYGV